MKIEEFEVQLQALGNYETTRIADMHNVGKIYEVERTEDTYNVSEVKLGGALLTVKISNVSIEEVLKFFKRLARGAWRR